MTQPSKGTILVVDDDRLVLAMLAHGLSQAGYDVIDADNGDDAILLAREHRPQLALLDIRMQGKSGFDVAAYLRESCRIPFIFLSAFADAQTVAQVKALGAVAYLVKPLDVDQILPVVAEAFASLVSRRDEAKADDRNPARVAPTPDVLMAIGVLMHRHSLVRAAALERLQRLAAAENLTVAEQATRVIEAIERLALPPTGT
ncbi:MAG: response regulator [Burkholderiales bacterium]|nr:response regulator [Burkholderiales bacterium]